MVRLILVVFLMMPLASGANASELRSDILVTPDWLAEHLNDPSLVILQAADLRSDYSRGHIPGARFLWPGWLEKSTPDLNIELFPVARMDSVFESLGISNSSQIVLCHTYKFASAASVARAWVMLDYLGMGDRTRILDGGFEAWQGQGKPVTKEVPKYTEGSLTPMIKEGVFVDLEYVRANAAKAGVCLVDSRRPSDFSGDAGSVLRTGHIPGAISLPYASVMDETLHYFPADTLRARLTEAGIEPGEDIISYCYKGKAACLICVAATTLGHDVHVYDGSFEEWCGHEDLPLEVSTAEK